MKRICAIIFLMFLCGCTPAPTRATPLPPAPSPTPAVPCTASGEVIPAELAKPARGYAYHYQVYLPPCFSAESESRYPVIYLVPGRGSPPEAWFNAGLAKVVDDLILSGEVPPFLIIVTENTDSDPMADTIYKELLPVIESQYPTLDDRRYRAAAGGSLGGIAAYRLAFQYPETFSSAGMFGSGAISGEEPQIQNWLAAMTDVNRVRVFMDTGDEDIFMLQRAQVMQTLLNGANVENELHVGHGGHNYTYWISNFEMYLKWLTKDW